MSRHPSSHTPSSSDISALRDLASFVSRRSAAIVAACLHAIWSLRLEALDDEEAEYAGRERLLKESGLVRTMVAYNGSVIEHYPGYLQMLQGYVDGLVDRKDRSIDLVPAKESSLLGAGVALATCDAA